MQHTQLTLAGPTSNRGSPQTVNATQGSTISNQGALDQARFAINQNHGSVEQVQQAQPVQQGQAVQPAQQVQAVQPTQPVQQTQQASNTFADNNPTQDGFGQGYQQDNQTLDAATLHNQDFVFGLDQIQSGMSDGWKQFLGGQAIEDMDVDACIDAVFGGDSTMGFANQSQGPTADIHQQQSDQQQAFLSQPQPDQQQQDSRPSQPVEQQQVIHQEQAVQELSNEGQSIQQAPGNGDLMDGFQYEQLLASLDPLARFNSEN